MYPQKKNTTPLVLGIVSIVFCLVIALVGVVTGILGLVTAINSGKKDGLDYKLEIVLSSIGLTVAAINWILGILLILSA